MFWPLQVNSTEQKTLILVTKFFFFLMEDRVWKYLVLWPFWVKLLHLEYWLTNWHFVILHILHSSYRLLYLINSSSFKSIQSLELYNIKNSSSTFFKFWSMWPKVLWFHAYKVYFNNFNPLLTGHPLVFCHSAFTNFLKSLWENKALRHLNGFGPKFNEYFKDTKGVYC